MVKWLLKGILYVVVFFTFLSLSDLIVSHLEKRKDLYTIGLLAGFACGLIRGLSPKKGLFTFGANLFLLQIAILPATRHICRREHMSVAMAFAGVMAGVLLGLRLGKRLKSSSR